MKVYKFFFKLKIIFPEEFPITESNQLFSLFLPQGHAFSLLKKNEKFSDTCH